MSVCTARTARLARRRTPASDHVRRETQFRVIYIQSGTSLAPVEMLRCGRHASPVTGPDNSGRRALHHLKAVHETVVDVIQDSGPVV